MTGQELVDQVKQQGFDNTDAEILGWIDERQKEMVAFARARRDLVSLGNTVVDQQSYSADATIVELLEMTVGGRTYTRGRHADISSAAQDGLVWVGSGIFIPQIDASSVEQFALLPVPTSVEAIVAYAAIRGAAAALGSALVIPDEFVRFLRYGAIATGWELNAEDGNTADRYEAKFEDGKERYRRWIVRRFRGSGPTQIRVAGLNA